MIAAVIAHGQPARGESQHIAPVLASGDASGVLLANRAGAVGVHRANFVHLLGHRIPAHAAGATGDDSLEGELLPLAVLQFGLSRVYADRPALEGANVERRHVPVRPRSLQVDGVPPGAVGDHRIAHGRAYRVERLGQAFDVFVVVRVAEPSPTIGRDDGWLELDRFGRRLGAQDLVCILVGELRARRGGGVLREIRRGEGRAEVGHGQDDDEGQEYEGDAPCSEQLLLRLHLVQHEHVDLVVRQVAPSRLVHVPHGHFGIVEYAIAVHVVFLREGRELTNANGVFFGSLVLGRRRRRVDDFVVAAGNVNGSFVDRMHVGAAGGGGAHVVVVGRGWEGW